MDIPLKHRLLAILALAAFKGQNRVPLREFYEIFADLSMRFPDAFPGLYVGRTAHSKQLDSALQSLIGSVVDITNLLSSPNIEIKDTSAARIVQRLKASYGESAIDYFDPIASELIWRVECYSHISLESMEESKRALFERIVSLREKNGPIGFDIVEALRKMREEDDHQHWQPRQCYRLCDQVLDSNRHGDR